MDWLKLNWFKISLIVLALGAFYWYELRPANIRAECKKYLLSGSGLELTLTNDAEKEALGGDINKINRAEQEKSDYWYKDCLNERGLKE